MIKTSLWNKFTIQHLSPYYKDTKNLSWLFFDWNNYRKKLLKNISNKKIYNIKNGIFDPDMIIGYFNMYGSTTNLLHNKWSGYAEKNQKEFLEHMQKEWYIVPANYPDEASYFTEICWLNIEYKEKQVLVKKDLNSIKSIYYKDPLTINGDRKTLLIDLNE